MEKYFEAIVGNEKLKKILAADFKSKRHNHAYIIEGPRGSGKRTFAREMAKALLCTGHSDTFPCGACPSCRKIDAGYCTDIYTLNRGDAAGISVESVRSMTETVSYPPDDGEYKIYIIEEADKMTVQAQNAFLLSLEEPPAYVMYLLLCTDLSSLLETVRSRAPVIKTEVFPIDFISKWIRTTPAGAVASEKAIESACAVSGGALGVALNCLNGKEKLRTDIANEAGEAIAALCTKSTGDRILFFSSVKHTREEYAIFFDFALLALRDLIAAKSGGTEQLFYADADAALDISARIKLSRLLRMFERFEEAKIDITQKNASASAVMYTLAAEV